MKRFGQFLFCTDVPEPNCCGSCHSEWADEVGEPFDDEVSKQITYYHCCDARIPSRAEAIQIVRKKNSAQRKHWREMGV